MRRAPVQEPSRSPGGGRGFGCVGRGMRSPRCSAPSDADPRQSARVARRTGAARASGRRASRSVARARCVARPRSRSLRRVRDQPTRVSPGCHAARRPTGTTSSPTLACGAPERVDVRFDARRRDSSKSRRCFMMVAGSADDAPRREDHPQQHAGAAERGRRVGRAPGPAWPGRWSLPARAGAVSVQTADDADAAFEEALLHPPDVVLIDDRMPPAGGVELCQRLKGNVRTHFVPVIVFALNDLRQFRLRALAAGADAVFAPSTDAQERRTRLWALLRTRALLPRVERKQRDAEAGDRRAAPLAVALPARSAGAGGGAGRQRRLPGQVRARRRATRAGATSTRASRTRRAVFEQLMATCARCMDYDRFETGQLVPREARMLLGETCRRGGRRAAAPRRARRQAASRSSARRTRAARSTATASCCRRRC